MSSAPSAPIRLLRALGSIADQPGDSDDERLKHAFLVYMGVLMSMGGLLWGTIALAFGLWLPAIVPYGYTVATIINFAILRATRRFGPARFVQVLISLLLPFLFQFSLGGFEASGGVMLWAMLSLVGSLTFSERRASISWLAVYVAMTVFAGLIDAEVAARFALDTSDAVHTVFSVVNISIISSIVFGLTIYLLARRDHAADELRSANTTITRMNAELEDQVADRTRALAAALAQLQAIFDNVVDGMVAVDDQGRVLAANPAAVIMMTLPGEPTGLLAEDSLPRPLVELASRATSAGEVVRTEVALAGGGVGAAVASPLHSGAGDGRALHGVVIVVRDVSLEKEIDRMKTDFIATVSHELRTPLTSVLGFAKLTRSKLDANVFPHVPEGERKAQRAMRQAAGNLDIIVSEGQRLTTLINDVLDISKMEAGRMEWRMGALEVDGLVDRAAKACASLFPDEAVVLGTDVKPGLPSVVADEDRLLQVLINLVSNAAKFTEAGSVTISAAVVGDRVEIAVQDTGEGIEPALHDSIFEKFKQVGDTLTSKPKGTGLGLPICRQIVHAHGGELRVESRPGEGARFSFSLPAGLDIPVLETPSGHLRPLPPAVADLARRLDELRAPAALADPAAVDILVVDDDASVREMLRQELSGQGYGVRLAASGPQAMAAVRDQVPDLVVLDVMMPGLSGFDVAAMLRNDPRTEAIPILILSIVQDAARGARAGVDRYLSKPATAEQLLGAVQELLSQACSRQRVLVVDQLGETGADVQRLLETKGFVVVGSVDQEAAVGEIRRVRPDLVVLDALAPGAEAVEEALRLDRDGERVLVVRMGGSPEESA